MTDQPGPWDRGAYKRFGFHLEPRTQTSPESKLGWAIVTLKPPLAEQGLMKTDDPFAALIEMAQKAMSDGAEGVDLYRYPNATAFAKSQAAAEGMSHADHEMRITMAAAALRELSIPVNVLMVMEQQDG